MNKAQAERALARLEPRIKALKSIAVWVDNKCRWNDVTFCIMPALFVADSERDDFTVYIATIKHLEQYLECCEKIAEAGRGRPRWHDNKKEWYVL